MVVKKLARVKNSQYETLKAVATVEETSITQAIEKIIQLGIQAYKDALNEFD